LNRLLIGAVFLSSDRVRATPNDSGNQAFRLILEHALAWPSARLVHIDVHHSQHAMTARSLFLALMLALGAAVPAAAQTICEPIPVQDALTQDPTEERDLGVTAAAFQAIRPGTSLRQAEVLIGCAGEFEAETPDDGALLYTWTGPGPFEVIMVNFVKDSAVSSTEIGLYPTTGGPIVTLEHFKALREGMTQEQVKKLLGGPGAYVGFTEFMRGMAHQYRWHGESEGSMLFAYFIDGVLRHAPHQNGLR
jgi:hypothetical protein